MTPPDNLDSEPKPDGPKPDGPKPDEPKPDENRGGTAVDEHNAKWPICGIVAGVLWFMLFATGVLVDSLPYREALGWKPAETKQAAERKELLSEMRGLFQQPAPSKDTTKPSDARPDAVVVRKDGEKQSDCECASLEKLNRCFVENFLMAAISFIPLNIGLLTILAAFVGGCSVNENERKQLVAEVARLDVKDDRSADAERLRRRLNYLIEHPGYSAIRGLVIYLVVISGLFLAGSSLLGTDSQEDQLMQYIKLAGLFSFLGYLAGFDPTVFTSMIDFGSARVRPGSSGTQN